MPVFSYAFIQKDNKLYSYLKRNSNNQPFFDMVIFNEKNYIIADNEQIIKKWCDETSFCPSFDTVDFLFVIPLDSSLKISKGDPYVKSGWNKKTISLFLEKATENGNISGSIENGIMIDGTEYRLIRYSAEELPDLKITLDK